MTLSRMRVAVVTQYPRDPRAPRGGVEAVSVNLVQALARLDDLDVQVVTTDPEVAVPRVEEIDGAMIHRLPRGGGALLSEAVRAGRRRVLQCLEGLRPDVVHSHDVYGLMVQGVAAPSVFTVHGFIYADTRVSGERLPWLRSALWRLFEVRGWASHGDVIAISPYVRERLSGRIRGRIHDIENPIAREFFDVERREEPGVVFSAALIERRKNPLALVEALIALRARGVDARLRLAGPVREPDYGRMLESRVAAVPGHVDLLGSLPSPAVREELARASVFALASLEENAPMGIAEAMAAGVPVVASDRCGMPYMVKEGGTGHLVDPLDVADVTDRLAALLSDPARRSAMGELARRLARERHHPDVVAARTREVYRRAVARRATGR